MQKVPATALSRIFAAVAVVLIIKVALSVVIGYRDYFPPDFDSDFLLWREVYFWGHYHWAFYTHWRRFYIAVHSGGTRCRPGRAGLCLCSSMNVGREWKHRS